MKRSAITVTEMLVVMSIIAILTTATMGTFGSVRNYSRTIACLANTKSLAQSMAVYESSSGRFAPMFTIIKYRDANPRFKNLDQPSQISNYWFETIGAKAFCPARKIVRPKDYTSVDYGLNACISGFSDRPLKAAQLATPAKTFLLTDAGFAGVAWQNASPFANAPPGLESSYIPGLKINVKKMLRSDTKSDAVNGRHCDAKVAAAFADCHSESLNAIAFEVKASRPLPALWRAN